MTNLDSYLWLMMFALIGAAISMAITFIPGLHVLNVIGFAMLGYIFFFPDMDPMAFTMVLVGMLTGFSVLFTLTSIYFSTPDDSTMFIVMPAQKYLAQGRGHEAVLLNALGALIALFFMVIVLTFAQHYLIVIRQLITPHWGWVIGAVVVYILMSEFPKDFTRSRSRFMKFLGAWKTLAAGYFTFFLASVLGFIVFYKTTIPLDRAFQSLMPVFVGLFAVPACLFNIISDFEIPKQFVPKSMDITAGEAARGGGSGCLGGLFSAFIPAVTAGVGGFLSGHATGQTGDKPFVMSYGANRVVYYVGAVMLFFIPGLHLRRGGTSIMLNLVFIPETAEQYYLLAAAVAITGALSFIALLGLSRVFIKVLERVNYQNFQVGILVFMLLLVFFMAGWRGLLMMSVATAIGIIPVMFHSRRTNLLAVILVPIWLNIAGFGPMVAGWLGLL